MVDIIGAGIGGLTTSIALARRGIRSRIFERAKMIKPVGAGIILANNAMQVYEKIGLKKAIEENGNYISSMNITKANLQHLAVSDMKCFEQKYGVKTIAIHRGTLQSLLVDALKDTELILDHGLDTIVSNDLGYDLTFHNGIRVSASVVIGADGIHSTVREQLFSENTIRNAKQLCWRGIATFTLPLKYKQQLTEAWGASSRFGFVQITENQVYWYALKSFERNNGELTEKHLGDYFAHYDLLIQELIASTPTSQLFTADITDLKPIHNWHSTNACLIGDAAHAMTPNMGQGACQAIEDAFVLAACLEKYGTDKAFSMYQKNRLSKAHQIVKTSWFIGKMAHIKNPLLAGLRNRLLQLLPAAINRKQNEQLFELAAI